MHLQINANCFIQIGTTAGQLDSQFLDVMLSHDLLLTPHRPFSLRVPRAWAIERRVPLCMLDHPTVGIALQATLGEGFGSLASEAPRPETPCQAESGTVVSRDAT